MIEPDKLTKTDFLLYLESPLHFWAAKHGELKKESPTAQQLRLMEQGQEVEALADEFLAHIAGFNELQSQVILVDGHYESRSDFLLHDSQAGVYDLYEVKSSTSIKKEHEYDLAFQALVCAANLMLRDTYLVLVNREYTRHGVIDPQQFFKIEQLTNKVAARKEEVLLLREQALGVIQQETPNDLKGCLSPDTCPCPALCHPDLPPNPIYDLPRIGKKAADLQALGVKAIEDIPPDFPLSPTQRAQAELVKDGRPEIDRPAIRKFLTKRQYPLYFLDYETINPAIPLYDGYHPYGLAGFQYSLHVIKYLGAETIHYDELILDANDPAPRIAASLQGVLGPDGSVIVWNKSFEARCNQAMARLAPEYANFLEGVNARLLDLMDVFRKGYYKHPDFRGSSSLKCVLPVLVPELTYEDLMIQDGEQAMQAMWEILNDDPESQTRDQVERALRAYCARDTFAMAKIWDVLAKIGN